MTGNDADAADATQEALITIAKRIDRFDGRAKFTTWLYRVATNACLDELRRRGRRAVPGLPEHPAAELDTSPAFDTAVVDRMAIDEALGHLSAEFLAPIVLRDQLGMDYAEIAQILGIPPGTVRSRIARGRAQLATSLGNHHPAGERPTPESP
jgi:RNA polymerase sigma-70 factor, ECF subfamily